MDSPEEYLWMDKHKPKSLNELTFNPTVTKILTSLAAKDDFPHLIFYGPEGAGKKTRIHAFLEKIYGPGVHKINTEIREVKQNSTTIEYNISSSNYHIELCPSENDNHDRVIIQKVIKETSSVATIDPKTQKKFKVIVLLEVDNLTRDAQAALRRTMEKYSKNCRLIMSCNSLTKIIPPIRSRCLSIRVAYPTEKQLISLLSQIKNEENASVSDKQIEQIVKSSGNNIRKAINTLQLTTLDPNITDIFIPEYLREIKDICSDVMKEQSPAALKKMREKMVRLIVNGISIDEIILNITKTLITMCKSKSEKVKKEIVHYAAFYDNRAQNGTKGIFHLEALMARIMVILNQNK